MVAATSVGNTICAWNQITDECIARNNTCSLGTEAACRAADAPQCFDLLGAFATGAVDLDLTTRMKCSDGR